VGTAFAGAGMTEHLGAPRRMMSEKQILDLLPIARSTLQNWIKAKEFPQPVSIGPNRKAWFADEVAVWQNNRKAA
jgi:predicted DNA-binding transcriptional regulator AlpA